jgi:2-polyprenyl-3-methyl-5-hydroxy-6-metoxy-1,4-benzoquinol methylase
MPVVTATIPESPPQSSLRSKELLEVWRRSFVLDEFDDPVDSALRELSLYFDLSENEVRQRCLNWEQNSVEEWEAGDRTSPEGLLEFYHTTQSWIFDTMWYHAQQYHGNQPAESVMIAERLAGITPGRHLDFGSGPGSTSLFYQQLGWQVALADISTTLLDFARWRFAHRHRPADFYDLNQQELPTEQFDLITACDVMVHVPDPGETFRRLHQALKPNGLLVFNVDARPKRERENQWHLYLHAYPVLRPVRATGFARLPRLDFFHVYQKIENRAPASRAAVRLHDLARYNRLVSVVGDIRRALVGRS